MHSARPSSGGSVRALTSDDHATITTKTFTLGRTFEVEFGNRNAGANSNADRRSRRLPQSPLASGDGHP